MLALLKSKQIHYPIALKSCVDYVHCVKLLRSYLQFRIYNYNL